MSDTKNKRSTGEEIFSTADVSKINRITVDAHSRGHVIQVERRLVFSIREVNDAWVKSNK